MKPNFQAIDAIAYALRYGFTGLGTAIRLGWLTILITIGSIYVLETNDVEWDVAGLAGTVQELADDGAYRLAEQLQDVVPALQDWEIEIERGNRVEVEADEFTPVVAAATAGLFFGILLFIPAVVAMYRQSAGLEPRGGVLPAFGRDEWSFFAATIITGLLFVPVLLVTVGPTVALAVAVEGAGVPAFAPILAGILAFVILVWFSVRIALFPMHAALSGTINLGEAFGITGGRFWKLLGTFILLGIIFSLIDGAVSLASLAFAPSGFVWGTLALAGFFQLYSAVAQSGFYGRVTGALMGYLGDEDDGDEDDVEAPQAPATEADAASAEPAAPVAEKEASQPEAADTDASYAYGGAPAASATPQKPGSVQFIRKRFR